MTNLSKNIFISINLGNTNLSLASSVHKKFLSSDDSYPHLVSELRQWLEAESNLYLLLCSVVHEEDFQKRFPEVFEQVRNFKSQHPQRYLNFQDYRKDSSFLGMPIHYSLNLGQDRLIQSYKLWKNLTQDHQSCGLIIDAGTMTTLDLVSSKLGLTGGYIIPGLTSYSKIFQVSQKLPLANLISEGLKNTIPQHLPHTTMEAISYGYWHSFLALIENLQNSHSFEKIIISGGQAHYWYQYLKQSVLSKNSSIQLNILFPHESLWQIGEDMLK